jgi:hypothetical protein
MPAAVHPRRRDQEQGDDEEGSQGKQEDQLEQVHAS